MASPELTAASVRARLGLGDEASAWLDDLEAVGAPDEPVRLPPPGEAATSLARLGVPDSLLGEAVDAMPAPGREPALWWVLERCRQRLVGDMGGVDPLPAWPSLPAALGAAGRYFYVWVFVAALDPVRRYHAARGIPDDVARATLADLGQHVALHRWTHGEGGLSTQNWLTLHWRGALYQLGRLQYNRSRIYYDAATLAGLATPFGPGDPALGVHIPETGPLSPEACDDSFRRAREFFARHFPEETYRVATCGSWLLDEQLAEYLPATSNIIRFQRRFRPVPGGWDCDREIVRFVFHRVATPLDDLPQRTTLERAIVRHLRAGRHWFGRRGWLELEAPL